jgi:hypothetical protein
MAFQITELALDAEDKMTGRKVVPYPYQTRQEAVETIESVASRYVKSGYDREQRSWWAIAENGNQKRFVLEEI